MPAGLGTQAVTCSGLDVASTMTRGARERKPGSNLVGRYLQPPPWRSTHTIFPLSTPFPLVSLAPVLETGVVRVAYMFRVCAVYNIFVFVVYTFSAVDYGYSQPFFVMHGC